METNTTQRKSLVGIDQNIYAADNTASDITNFRWHEAGGFINDIGWEPLLPLDEGSLVALTDDEIIERYAATRFLGVWSKHEGAEIYYLYERNGNLQYDYGNIGAATTNNVILASNRMIPKSDDPGTQLIGCKRFALILNGYDKPLKFWGRNRIEQFGWSLPPGRMSVMEPQPTAIRTSGATELVDPNKSAILFGSTEQIGLGNPDNGSENHYSWCVAFLSNTGSISPMSDAVSTKWSITDSHDVGKFGVVLQDVPIGPEGTVGRIIYRTKNMTDGLSASINTFYEAFRIDDNVSTIAIDTIPDSLLSATPADLQASAPIAHGYKYGILWNNRIWLAGGSVNPNTIIYSEAGKYEQFGAFSYFETSARNGGAITGMIDYYNALLIFREQSIEIITVNASGGFSISTLDPFVGTKATNTIKFIPNIGVVFLTDEGVYALSGGLTGGSSYKAVSISSQLGEEWKLLTTTALARASAVYSKKEQEYWVMYPSEGLNENNRGAVFHIATKGWTLRNTSGRANNQGNLSFTQLATDPIGQIIMGTAPTYTGTYSTNRSWPGIGLQVWSRAAFAGQQYVYDSSTGSGASYAVTKATKIESGITSRWEDMGSLEIQKTIAHVQLECMSQGNNTIPCYYMVDNQYTVNSASPAPMQQSEYYNTTRSQNILSDTTGRPKAVWDSTVWERNKRIYVRYDIGSTKCSTFAFRLVSTNYLHLLTYRIAYTADGSKSMSYKG